MKYAILSGGTVRTLSSDVNPLTCTLIKFIKFVILIVSIQFYFVEAYSENLDLPEEELAKESVTPFFRNQQSVRNRNVVTESRFDFGLYYGWALTEPIANVSKLGFNFYYHPSENNAIGFFYNKNFTGQSDYAKQLNSQFGLDFSRAPMPDYTLMVDYNINAYYGKMSFTKNNVLNTHILGSLAAGAIKYVHKTYPAVAVGLGEKFYFNSQFSLRFDLRLFVNEAPIPFKESALKKDTTPNPPPYDTFSDRVTLTTVLDIGLSYLF